MRIRPFHIAIIFILVVIVFVFSSTGSTFLPYSRDTLFSREYPYEGMCSAPANAFPSAEPKKAEEPGMMDYVKSWIPGFAPAATTTEAKKVEGFALQPAPFADNQLIDRYSQTPASAECVGQSSGYSKSTGGLCMSEEDKRLLSTRGGNATGSDSAIGQQ
jgi:hypothetical protein